MTKVYRLPIKVQAIALVKADNKDDAFRRAREVLSKKSLEVFGDKLLTDLEHDDPKLPSADIRTAMIVGEPQREAIEEISAR